MPTEVMRLQDIGVAALGELLARYHLQLRLCPAGEPVPGSYWGEEEAGLKTGQLYARNDTPVHSILHEGSHFICMDSVRRQNLHTDAGSDEDEENAVCYLQVLLADELPGLGRERMFADMDSWGYSFRLGCSQAWFEQDAEDALSWLVERGLIDAQHRPSYLLRI